MKKSLIAIAIVALASSTAALAQQTRGGMDQLTFEQLLNIADTDKNKAVTRQEFLDAMGKVYDMKMDKFKSAKDTKMMQNDGLTREGMKSLINDIHHGA